MIARAFLAWQMTWQSQANGEISCDYAAATDVLCRYKIEDKHIETLYEMKLKWVGGRSG